MTGSSAPPAASSRVLGAGVVVTTGGRGGLTLDTIRELWAFREVFTAFVARRIKVRYKQALFGFSWVVIQPVATAAVFAVFLGKLAKFPSESGAPYFLFVLIGLAVWSYFAQTVTAAIDSLVQEASVLRKVYFPREIPPLSVVTAGLVDLSVSVIVVLAIVLFFAKGANLNWILIPIPLAVVVLTATGVSLLLSAVNVYYRDVSYAMPFLIQLGLFLSPVIYSTSIVPAGIRQLYEELNPLAAAIQALRDILLRSQTPDLGVLGLAGLWSIAVVLASYAVFKRIERQFADSV